MVLRIRIEGEIPEDLKVPDGKDPGQYLSKWDTSIRERLELRGEDEVEIRVVRKHRDPTTDFWDSDDVWEYESIPIHKIQNIKTSKQFVISFTKEEIDELRKVGTLIKDATLRGTQR